ncbi:MAG TPA: STAS domain-containing protein [Pirellulales bacterium]
MSDGADVFIVETKDGVCIVAPTKALDSLQWDVVDGSAARMIKASNETGSPPRMIFDLNQVTYFGSIFLSLMLRCWKHVDEHKGRFAICGLTPDTHKLIEVTKLHTVWKIYPNRVTALAELNRA